MVSIRGYGTYLPLYRIRREAIAEQHGTYARGGETAVPAPDENVQTLAVAALKNALSMADVDGASLDAVYAATTSDPFDERALAAHVGYAVGADGNVRVGDFQGSARATTNAILAARDAVTAGSADRVAVVATDVLGGAAGSDAEKTAGAGAGALVLDADGEVATLDATGVNTTGFVGRFTEAGETPTGGDAKFNRRHGYVDAVTGAIEELVGEFDPTSAAMPAPDDRWGDRALGALDVDPERHSTHAEAGYVGAASVLLDAVAALEAASPDDQLLVAAYGPGGADALGLTAGPAADTTPEMTTDDYAESKEYVTYAKHRSYRDRARGEA
ncbi:hypothetical protein ACKVMT_12940 [Halobacteriales archaeon Cl-PHB]